VKVSAHHNLQSYTFMACTDTDLPVKISDYTENRDVILQLVCLFNNVILK